MIRARVASSGHSYETELSGVVVKRKGDLEGRSTVDSVNVGVKALKILGRTARHISQRYAMLLIPLGPFSVHL
jgi:hypothetical protein